MKRLALAVLVLTALPGCAAKLKDRYIQIQQPDTVFEYGRPKFRVQPGDELEILFQQPCRGGHGTCWAVRSRRTGEKGFVAADQVRARHTISASPTTEPAGATATPLGDPAEIKKADQQQRMLAQANALLAGGSGPSVVPLLQKLDALTEGKCAECLGALSNAYYRSRRYRDVIATARRVIALGPSNSVLANAYNQLGLGYEGDGESKPDRLEEAEKAFRRALEIPEADRPTLRYNLARLLFRSNRADEARPLLQAVIDESPKSPIADRARLILDDPSCAVEECVPDFALMTLDGRELTRESLKGKAVLLQFWGMYCDNCRPNYEDLNQLAKRWAKDPFLVVVVVTDSLASAARVAERYQLTVPVAQDDGRVLRLLGAGGIPRVLLDHRGHVVWRSGLLPPREARSATASEVRKAVRRAREALAAAGQAGS